MAIVRGNDRSVRGTTSSRRAIVVASVDPKSVGELWSLITQETTSIGEPNRGINYSWNDYADFNLVE
jgi:hypothetical protein